MAKPPAFQLYAADFYMDTADWTIEEVGIYTRLLFYQWVNGKIPNDALRMARIAGCSKRKFDKHWPTVLKKFDADFFPKVDGYANKNEPVFLRNKRLESVRQQQREFIKNQVRSGSKGGLTTQEKRRKALSEPSSEPTSKPSSEIKALHTSTSSSTLKDINTKAASAPFELPTKEELSEASPIKTNSDMDNVCKQLYEEKIFPEVYAFCNKMIKAKTNEKAILHALCRCYVSKPEEPWPFCKKIVDVENGNYNERDHAKAH